MLGLLGALATLAAGIFDWLRGKKDQEIGQMQERSKEQAQVIKDVETRHEVETDVDRVPDPADELRRKWSRPD
jgi:hypothetical protein